jgi:hypothetical protein
MTTYAAVKDGKVRELFAPQPDWSDIPVEEMFTPETADEWVDVTPLDPQPAYGWTYDGTSFAPPPEQR